MCSVCRMTPCHPNCPNAPEPLPVCICSECGNGIFQGEKYLDLGDETYCRECLDDMDSESLLNLMGYRLATAEHEEVGEWD